MFYILITNYCILDMDQILISDVQNHNSIATLVKKAIYITILCFTNLK